MKHAGYHNPMTMPDLSGGTGVSPAGWLVENIRAWWTGSIEQRSIGRPSPMAPRDHYADGPPYKQPHRFGAFELRLTRRYDRGALAYAYRGGALTYNPIGAGVPWTRPVPIMQPAAIQLPFGNSLWWSPQATNFARVPAVTGAIYTPDQLAAMFGNPAVNNSGSPAVPIIPADMEQRTMDTAFGGGGSTF